MSGLIGKKIGMTSVFGADGKNIPCTVIEAGPCVVTQVKTVENDGYSAIQIAYDEKNEKNTSSGMLGHFKKAGTTPKRKLAEFQTFEEEFKLGDEITVEIFEDDDWVDVTGISKGKGFQGVVKRHGFAGAKESTHGSKQVGRSPGSIGEASTPGRLFKGKALPGRMGGDKVKVLNLRILKKIPEHNLILVKGSVPGAKGSYVLIED